MFVIITFLLHLLGVYELSENFYYNMVLTLQKPYYNITSGKVIYTYDYESV